MSIDTTMQSIWYGNSRIAWLLLPLSWLFGGIVAIRRWLYRIGWLSAIHLSKPVIVVGNISVGGTGKTPLVIWLANMLSSRGFKVAVIARGYRGAAAEWPQVVSISSDAALVGDEPVLISQQTGAIVVAGPDRVADAQRAIELGADVIVSDDGLQHYRLHRNCEIVVLDSSRLMGNGYLLPAGPLRENAKRLNTADLLLINQRTTTLVDDSVRWDHLSYRVELRHLRALKSGEIRSMESLRGQQVHVVTGIGNPHAFIDALQQFGTKVLPPRILADHATITPRDIQFGDALPVLMTTKDAVKCRPLSLNDQYWVVDADVAFEAKAMEVVTERVLASINRFDSGS